MAALFERPRRSEIRGRLTPVLKDGRKGRSRILNARRARWERKTSWAHGQFDRARAGPKPVKKDAHISAKR